MQWWDFLPDAPVLVYGKMDQLRPYLLEKMKDKSEFHDILRRTKEFYVSLVPGIQPDFYLMCLGDFPRGLSGLALSWNSSWTKGPFPPEQWVMKQNGMAVTLPEDGIILASNHPWSESLDGSAVTTISTQASQRSILTDLFLYFPKPGRLLLGESGDRLPLTSLWIPLKANATSWTGSLEFEFDNERQARLALTLVRLSAPNWMTLLNEWGIQISTQGVSWELDGNRAIVTPISIPFSILDGMILSLTGEEEP